jgi:Ca2+-binding RTX toxin-like protein
LKGLDGEAFHFGKTAMGLVCFQYFRAVVATVVGQNKDIAIPLGFQPISQAVALHSMNLHAAFIYDERLRQLAVDMPELVPVLLDKRIHTADPNFASEDLITRLVNDQLQNGFGNDSALKRFSGDLQKVADAGGTAGRSSMRTALITAATDYYALKTLSEAGSLLSASSNALHFDYREIGGQFFKSLPKLEVALSELVVSAAERTTLRPSINVADSWHIQRGSGSLNWTAEVLAHDGAVGGAQADALDGLDGNDLLIGLDGTDTLKGGSGRDTLVGGEGADWLSGGTGNDTLLGGSDHDTYVVDNTSDKTIESASAGIDTIESAIGWTLSSEVERLVITGTGVVNGTGNGSANQLVGNEAANILDGKAGVDILLGAGGNDTLQDTNGTSASGNSAFDGGAGFDTLKGTAGADLLAGGRGDDVLTLGGGTRQSLAPVPANATTRCRSAGSVSVRCSCRATHRTCW